MVPQFQWIGHLKISGFLIMSEYDVVIFWIGAGQN